MRARICSASMEGTYFYKAAHSVLKRLSKLTKVPTHRTRICLQLSKSHTQNLNLQTDGDIKGSPFFKKFTKGFTNLKDFLYSLLNWPIPRVFTTFHL